jgi:hypothetical protein
LANDEMPHVGTLDVDIGLDAIAWRRRVRHADRFAAGHGYARREGLRRFQMVRQAGLQCADEGLATESLNLEPELTPEYPPGDCWGGPFFLPTGVGATTQRNTTSSDN